MTGRDSRSFADDRPGCRVGCGHYGASRGRRLRSVCARSELGRLEQDGPATSEAYPRPAPPVQPKPCPPPPVRPLPPPAPLGPPVVREASIPLVGPPPSRRVALSSISGKGIWLTLWPGARVDATGVVAAARSAGLNQLWVRTGSSMNGFYGATVLAQLVPAARRRRHLRRRLGLPEPVKPGGRRGQGWPGVPDGGRRVQCRY